MVAQWLRRLITETEEDHVIRWTTSWDCLVACSFYTEPQDKVYLWYENAAAMWVWLHKLNQWGCTRLAAAFTSCCHPWGVTFQNHCEIFIHEPSAIMAMGAARYTELWTVQFVRSWLTDNKLYHQSMIVPSKHWAPVSLLSSSDPDHMTSWTFWETLWKNNVENWDGEGFHTELSEH